MKPVVNIFWFRRDLRLEDNAGLYHALKSGRPVVPIFIFDRDILDELEDKQDRRVAFIHQALEKMQADLVKLGSTLDARYGKPADVFAGLINDYNIEKVFTNNDYEPYARQRDNAIADMLGKHAISFHSYKDQLIFEKSEIVKDDSKPYTIFTPYSRKWKAALNDHPVQSYSTGKYMSNFFKQEEKGIPLLNSMGFEPVNEDFPPVDWDEQLISNYHLQREYPGIEGTSRLSVHLRFGTVSIRRLVREAGSLNDIFLNELIWREFYQMILWYFPEVVQDSFKREYDKIPWRSDEMEFKAWCEGRTGYPIVDAGMRQLNETGFMHNRVRMITASFLTKHLLIDWRWGEAYFAKKLLDYDLAANNGGWQWAAGSGCDAAPYFRIFNPYTQTKKFDPDLKYVQRWVPEVEGLSYPLPIIEHEFARKRCLEVYARALKK
jgi:deoxyribodipyrimidine photo-lyase